MKTSGLLSGPTDGATGRGHFCRAAFREKPYRINPKSYASLQIVKGCIALSGHVICMLHAH